MNPNNNKPNTVFLERKSSFLRKLSLKGKQLGSRSPNITYTKNLP